EALANDGSIATNANPLEYSITGGTFIDTNNDDILDGGFSISNLPSGLTARFILSNSDTTATLELIGNATNNNSADNVGALTITFTAGVTGSGVAPTVNCTTTAGINFRDNFNIDARMRHGKFFLNGSEQPMVTGTGRNAN
ncbi:hypothetical protein, partial [Flavivirga amylovorans]